MPNNYHFWLLSWLFSGYRIQA